MVVEEALNELVGRVEKKEFIPLLVGKWERTIGFEIEEGTERHCLFFTGGKVSRRSWLQVEEVDLYIMGSEEIILMLVSGEDLSYSYAKENVYVSGSIYDQLKLDSILRLTSTAFLEKGR
ncbi:hypothetical protein [Brevibacillus daliensis]|uniref:hypothetical protein n=1 Tax=Brevibacillus daliensis TaxID=2892995 RepID=UPI001E3C4F7C|nr:hypothetical protein [Brevibacillus daliensis]